MDKRVPNWEVVKMIEWGASEAVAMTIVIALAVGWYLWQAGKYNG